jgi:hypothetical protein
MRAHANLQPRPHRWPKPRHLWSAATASGARAIQPSDASLAAYNSLSVDAQRLAWLAAAFPSAAPALGLNSSSESPAWHELVNSGLVAVDSDARVSLAADPALSGFLREQAARAGVAQQNVIVVTEFYSALVQRVLAAAAAGELSAELRGAAERERDGVCWFVTSLMESAQSSRHDAQLEHAVQLAHVATRASAAILGAEHRVALRAARLHADLLHEKGALADARRVYEQTLLVQERVLGAEHDDALATKTELAATLDALDEHPLRSSSRNRSSACARASGAPTIGARCCPRRVWRAFSRTAAT